MSYEPELRCVAPLADGPSRQRKFGCARHAKLTLEELRVIEDHLAQLDQQMADRLRLHHDAVHRLAEVPGLGVDSAQQNHCGSRRHCRPNISRATPSNSARMCGDRAKPPAEMFSRRCATDEVPGISRMFGERWSSQASATCIGVASSRSATVDSADDCSGVKPPSGKNGT